MDKILLFMPTYQIDGLDQVWPDSLDSFNALKSPDGVKIKRVIGRDNPYDQGHRNTLHQFQNAQRLALKSDYAALVTFEHDMIVPEDGLIKLWETSAPVVYGLYVLRHGSQVVNAFRWMNGSPNIDQSLSLFPDLYENAIKNGSVQVSGCGNGFTLMRREVLERFPLRAWDETSFVPDWAFASDCQVAGVTQICRFDVQCGHIEDSGKILWPSTCATNIMRVHIQSDFTGFDGHNTRRFYAGTDDQIVREHAIEFARAGFLRIYQDESMPVMARERKAKL